MQTFPYMTLRCFFHVLPMAMTTVSTCDPSDWSVFSRITGSNLFSKLFWGIFGNNWSTGEHFVIQLLVRTHHHFFTIP